MDPIPGNIRIVVDGLYKSHYGKFVAALLGFSRDLNVETAEDIIQDSFAKAIEVWKEGAVPGNPAGWIYTVAKNKALNNIKREKKTSTFEEEHHEYLDEIPFSEIGIEDQQLKLLFACAHPDLSPKVQVVITLKYVANLRVEAIAKALAMSIDGIDKLLFRARQKIRDEKILVTEFDLAAAKYRLPIVHKILYLLYNEGFKSSSGKELLREELCEEALLMNKSILDHQIGDFNTEALQALMLFNAARFKARFDPAGQLLNLEEQDRSLWDQGLIRLGKSFLERSQQGTGSAYHYEASIAYLHCTAIDFASTNWRLICRLYKRLLEFNENPFVELNYAIAVYYSGEKEKAIEILNRLMEQPFLHQYYSLNAALGKIHLLEGNKEMAREFFSKAEKLTSFREEKKLMQRMLDKI